MATQRVKTRRLTRLPAEGVYGGDHDVLYRREGGLLEHFKRAYRFNFIAKPFNPPGMPLTRGEKINDIASNAEFSHLFNHGNAPITALDQLGGQLLQRPQRPGCV